MTANYGWEILRSSFVRVGDIINLNFYAHVTDNYSPGNSYTVLNLSLPSEYKPQVDVIITAGIMSNGDVTNAQSCPVTIDSDNKIKVYTPSQLTTGYLSGNLTWKARR